MKLLKFLVIVFSYCVFVEISVGKEIASQNISRSSSKRNSSTQKSPELSRNQDIDTISRLVSIVTRIEEKLEKFDEKIVNIHLRLEDVNEKLDIIDDNLFNERTIKDASSSRVSINTKLHLWMQKINELDRKIDKLINENNKKFDDSNQEKIDQPLQLKFIEDVLPLDLAIIALQTKESVERIGEKIQQNVFENGEKLEYLNKFLRGINKNNISREDELSQKTHRKERRISNHSGLITDIVSMVRERLQSESETPILYEAAGSLTDILSNFENMTSPNVTQKIKTVPRKDRLIFPQIKNKPSKLNTSFVSEAKDSKGFSCAELLNAGMRQSGVYYLQIRGTIYWFLKVYCEQEIADGGWTVIQRRDDFGEPRENFNRDWADYKNGFGDPAREFWMGNQNIYMLTNHEDHALRIELEDFEGNKRYAQYSHFKIHSEADYYKLEIDGYEGNAGDSLNDLTYGSNNSPFSTYNRDNDRSSLNCASMLKGGWWWKSCGRGLNGLYLQHPNDIAAKLGIIWFKWKGWDYTLKKSTMMIKPLTKSMAL